MTASPLQLCLWQRIVSCLCFSPFILLSVKVKAWSAALPTEQARPFPSARSCLRRCKESHGSDPEGRYDRKDWYIIKNVKSADNKERFYKAREHIKLINKSSPQPLETFSRMCYFVHRPDATHWQCVYPQWEVCLANLVLLEKGLVRAQNIYDISEIAQQGYSHSAPWTDTITLNFLPLKITKNINIKVKDRRYKGWYTF